MTPGPWDGPGVDAWRAWTPDELAARLAGVDRPWCVVGGWAVDLFLGTVTRRHGDLEIVVLGDDVPAFRQALQGFVFHAVGDGKVRRVADGEATPPDVHQHWVLDEAAQAWRVDVMTEPGDDDWWVYRRDQRIRRPRAAMVARTPTGVPYLRPEGALLHKSSRARPKDEADLAACLPAMDRTARRWLVGALRRVDPGHPWLGMVDV